MHLLLVSATQPEINTTAHWLESHSFELNVLKPKMLISGIGQLQTTFHIQREIAAERPALIIQAGIGGAVNESDIGQVYAIGSERIGDLGLLSKSGFSSVFEIGLEPGNKVPFTDEKLVNPYRSLLEWTALPSVDGITVNEIKSADFCGFQRNTHPVVESMEGASLHYICLMEKIPFLQIRSISNVIGERDKSRWKLDKAIIRLNETLINLIQKLDKADESLLRI